MATITHTTPEASSASRQCPKCEGTARSVSGECLTCSRARSRAWRQKNPERRKQYMKQWRVANKRLMKETYAVWYAKNREAKRAYYKDWYQNNRGTNLAMQKAWRDESPERMTMIYRLQYAKHRARILLKTKRFRLNFPERRRAYEAARRARKAGSGGAYTAMDVVLLLTRQRNRCANHTCRVNLRKGYHLDHILPLSKRGDNGPRNIQLLCPPCNMTKGAKDPLDWARINGLLI